MITIIKNFSLISIKNKLLVLYILNVTDIIFTLFLISSGLFIEVNPLMYKVTLNQSNAITLKIVLPAVLLLVLSYRMQKATDYQLRISNSLINIVLLLYVMINISHITWATILWWDKYI